VVGHSFGGGVAMQFAYQFPERTERLVLVAPGGLGPEVTPAIRALTLPGADRLVAMAALPGVRQVTLTTLRTLASSGLPVVRDLDEVAAIVDSFKDPRARQAVRQVVSAVIDRRGQVVTMADRAYLTQAMPMCVIWGRQDAVIPVAHADIAAELAPGATVEVIEDAGHFPHKDHPRRFTEILDGFIRTHPAATYHRGRWRALLKAGRPTPLPAEEAAIPKMEIA
jgi:pimeloyl-ACP methyl ester carboxylesterase